MTNYDKYKSTIIETLANSASIALRGGKIETCLYAECSNCDFNKNNDCIAEKKNWLNAEYIEKPKLTQREWHLCKALKTRYLARGDNGALYMYEKKPHRSGGMWFSPGVIVSVENIMPDSFSFIKWQDAEPWSVEDLLKLEVQSSRTERKQNDELREV